MAEAKEARGTVVIYFSDTTSKAEAIEIAKKSGCDPTTVKKHRLGEKSVYGAEAEVPSAFIGDYQTQYVNARSNENKSEIRGQRCDVPGKRNHLKKCSENNKCEGCPLREFKPTTLSIHQTIEDFGYDVFGAEEELDIQQRIEFKETIEAAREISPSEVSAFLKFYAGATKKELQEEFDKSESTINRWLDLAINLIREIWFSEY